MQAVSVDDLLERLDAGKSVPMAVHVTQVASAADVLRLTRALSKHQPKLVALDLSRQRDSLLVPDSGNCLGANGIGVLFRDGLKTAGVNLQLFNVRGNKLGKQGAEVLAKVGLPMMPHLRHLDLEGNGIESGLDALCRDGFKYVPALSLLNLSRNNLGDDGLVRFVRAGVPRLLKLTALGLADNDISPVGLSVFARNACTVLQQLRELNLSFNNLGPDGIRILVEDALPHLAQLTVLDVSGNSIRASGMTMLMQNGVQHTRRLQQLNLSHSVRPDEAMAGLQALVMHGLPLLPDLLVLQLQGNAWGPLGVLLLASKGLRHVPKLQVLDLGDTAAGDEGVIAMVRDGLGHVPLLGDLNLAANMITDASGVVLAAELSRVPELQALSLPDNDLGDATADALVRGLWQVQLTRLDLSGNGRISRDGARALLATLLHSEPEMASLASEWQELKHRLVHTGTGALDRPELLFPTSVRPRLSFSAFLRQTALLFPLSSRPSLGLSSEARDQLVYRASVLLHCADLGYLPRRGRVDPRSPQARAKQGDLRRLTLVTATPGEAPRIVALAVYAANADGEWVDITRPVLRSAADAGMQRASGTSGSKRASVAGDASAKAANPSAWTTAGRDWFNPVWRVLPEHKTTALPPGALLPDDDAPFTFATWARTEARGDFPPDRATSQAVPPLVLFDDAVCVEAPYRHNRDTIVLDDLHVLPRASASGVRYVQLEARKPSGRFVDDTPIVLINVNVSKSPSIARSGDGKAGVTVSLKLGMRVHHVHSKVPLQIKSVLEVLADGSARHVSISSGSDWAKWTASQPFAPLLSPAVGDTRGVTVWEAPPRLATSDPLRQLSSLKRFTFDALRTLFAGTLHFAIVATSRRARIAAWFMMDEDEALGHLTASFGTDSWGAHVFCGRMGKANVLLLVPRASATAVPDAPSSELETQRAIATLKGKSLRPQFGIVHVGAAQRGGSTGTVLVTAPSMLATNPVAAAHVVADAAPAGAGAVETRSASGIYAIAAKWRRLPYRAFNRRPFHAMSPVDVRALAGACEPWPVARSRALPVALAAGVVHQVPGVRAACVDLALPWLSIVAVEPPSQSVWSDWVMCVAADFAQYYVAETSRLIQPVAPK